jgi:DNA-binding protein Fis
VTIPLVFVLTLVSLAVESLVVRAQDAPRYKDASRPVAERVAAALGGSTGGSGDPDGFPVEGVALDQVELDLLKKAMTKAGNNKSQAAKLLGVTRGQLYSLLRKHGLTDARR